MTETEFVSSACFAKSITVIMPCMGTETRQALHYAYYLPRTRWLSRPKPMTSSWIRGCHQAARSMRLGFNCPVIIIWRRLDTRSFAIPGDRSPLLSHGEPGSPRRQLPEQLPVRRFSLPAFSRSALTTVRWTSLFVRCCSGTSFLLLRAAGSTIRSPAEFRKHTVCRQDNKFALK